jgi:hypothetical protein
LRIRRRSSRQPRCHHEGPGRHRHAASQCLHPHGFPGESARLHIYGRHAPRFALQGARVRLAVVLGCRYLRRAARFRRCHCLIRPTSHPPDQFSPLAIPNSHHANVRTAATILRATGVSSDRRAWDVRWCGRSSLQQAGLRQVHGMEDPLNWLTQCEQFFRGQQTLVSDRV